MESKINLNIDKDDHNLNDFIICWNEFGSRPNRINIYNTYSYIEFNKKIPKSLSKNYFTEVIPDVEFNVINDKVLIKLSSHVFMSYIVMDRESDNSVINEVSFLYKDHDKSIEYVNEIIESLNSCLVELVEDESVNHNLSTIIINNNGLEIEPIQIGKIDIDNIDIYYNDKTIKSLDKLVKSIKKSDKGLSIFYGDRGTGKTSTISYIASKLDSMVIFIPNSMIETTINNPDFRRFLKSHHKPVIVIDDCEMLFNEAFSKSNMFVNNLLQMVDGFLSDSLNVNIITIFNVEEDSEIDHTLLDCNNLTGVVNFEYLSEKESNDLSKHLGQDKKYKKENRLVDVVKNRKSKSTIKIGF